MDAGVNKLSSVDVNALRNKYSMQNTFGSNIRVEAGTPTTETGGVGTVNGGYEYSVPKIKFPKASKNMAYDGFRETLPGDRVTYKARDFDLMA